MYKLNITIDLLHSILDFERSRKQRQCSEFSSPMAFNMGTCITSITICILQSKLEYEVMVRNENSLFGFLVRPRMANENGPSPADVEPAIRIEYSVSFCRPVSAVVVTEFDCQ